MFTSTLVLAIFVLMVVNVTLWRSNARLHDLLTTMTSQYARVSQLLAGLLAPKPEVTAADIIARRSKQQPFKFRPGWSEQRAVLEAQYPDPFEAALKQAQQYEVLTQGDKE